MRKLLLLLALTVEVSAQEHHAQGHGEYQNWSSQKTANCCNNQDCGVLGNDDVRETNAGTEVRIGVVWCPVEQKHFITRGKSPDWNNPHACINKNPDYQATNVCDRLLCFAGKGGV